MVSQNVHCCSVAKSCPTLCDPMDCSRTGFPVHHQLLELAPFMSIKLVMPGGGAKMAEE